MFVQFAVMINLQRLSVGLGAFNILFGGVLFGSLFGSVHDREFWLLFSIVVAQIFGKWLRCCPEEVYYNYKREEYEKLVVNCASFFPGPGAVQSVLDALTWFDISQCLLGSAQIALGSFGWSGMPFCHIYGQLNCKRGEMPPAIDSRACACLKIFFSSVIIKGALLMIKSILYLHVEAQGNLEMIFCLQQHIKFNGMHHPYAIHGLSWCRRLCKDAFSVSLITTQKDRGDGAAGDNGHIDVICFVTSYGVKRSQTPPEVKFRLYRWCSSPNRVTLYLPITFEDAFNDRRWIAQRGFSLQDIKDELQRQAGTDGGLTSSGNDIFVVFDALIGGKRRACTAFKLRLKASSMTSIDTTNQQVRVEGCGNPEGSMTLMLRDRPAVTKPVGRTGTCPLSEIELLHLDSAFFQGNRSTLCSGAQLFNGATAMNANPEMSSGLDQDLAGPGPGSQTSEDSGAAA